MKLTVETTAEGMLAGVADQVAGLDPAAEIAAELASATLVDKAHVEAELDKILVMLARLWSMEPDQVLRVCSAISARLTELYIHLHRVEGRYREWRQVRTQQVVKLLEEVDRQFKFHSRGVEVRKQDLEMMRGY